MKEQFVAYLDWLPPEITTILIAMVPIFELRGAIPWALAAPPIGGGLTWQSAYLYAIIGNFIPVIPILLWIEPVSNWLRRFKIFDRFFDWLFARTRKRAQKNIERYEALGLILFVGIPLPVTGAWTGALAAFIFGIKFRRAILCITGGILIAGVVVTLVSLGVISFLDFLT